MTIIEERRGIAAKLRGLHLNTWDDAACEIATCAGVACCNSECHGSDETPECARALCDRLADLIEPCDRDALIMLAGEMEGAANPSLRCRGCSSYPCDAKEACVERKMERFAGELREAVGA